MDVLNNISQSDESQEEVEINTKGVNDKDVEMEDQNEADSEDVDLELINKATDEYMNNHENFKILEKVEI